MPLPRLLPQPSPDPIPPFPILQRDPKRPHLNPSRKATIRMRKLNPPLPPLLARSRKVQPIIIKRRPAAQKRQKVSPATGHPRRKHLVDSVLHELQCFAHSGGLLVAQHAETNLERETGKWQLLERGEGGEIGADVVVAVVQVGGSRRGGAEVRAVVEVVHQVYRAVVRLGSGMVCLL